MYIFAFSRTIAPSEGSIPGWRHVFKQPKFSQASNHTKNNHHIIEYCAVFVML